MNNFMYVSVVFEAAIILACVIFIALFVATDILPQKVKRNGVMLFVNLLFIAFFYLLINIKWFELAKPLIWLFVPGTITVSLFFYRFNTIWMGQKMKIDKLLLYVPVIVLILAIVFETLNYTSPDNAFVQTIRIQFTELTMRLLFPVYSGVLIVLNYLKIKVAEKENKDAYAEYHLVNLNWSRISLAFYCLFYIGMIASELTGPLISELTFNVSILTLVLYLGYYQMRAIAKYLKSTAQSIEVEKEERTKLKSRSDSTKLMSIFKQLEDLVNDEQLYLKTDLTIHELGVRLDLNSKYLSQAINQKEDLNFNKYINQKRIAHAKELMLDQSYKNYSLEGIGRESGFRSKSTFNTTFKSYTGLTPSEYRKKGLQ